MKILVGTLLFTVLVAANAMPHGNIGDEDNDLRNCSRYAGSSWYIEMILNSTVFPNNVTAEVRAEMQRVSQLYGSSSACEGMNPRTDGDNSRRGCKCNRDEGGDGETQDGDNDAQADHESNENNEGESQCNYNKESMRQRLRNRANAERPEYEVECSPGSLYEVRRYTRATWVSMRVNTTSIEATKTGSYKKIKFYHYGCNNQSSRFNKTLPTQIRVSNVSASDTWSFLRPGEQFRLAKYLPRSKQANPPVPTDGNLTLVTEELYVFAMNFTGYPYGLTGYTEYRNLKRYLDEDGNSENYQPSEFILNQFSSVFDKTGGQNEVLIPVRVGAKGVCDIPHGIRQCGRAECPEFSEPEILAPNIIKRAVGEGLYATHESSSCSYDQAFSQYLDLHFYFYSNNLKGLRMERTTPIMQWARNTTSTKEPRCDFTYRLGFYLPEEYHATPPTPNNPAVVLQRRPERVEYVIIFEEDGTSIDVVKQKYDVLTEFLETHKPKLCYDDSRFDVSIFDGRGRARPYRHELSVPVRECKQTV